MFLNRYFRAYLGSIFLVIAIGCIHNPLWAAPKVDEKDKPLVMGVFPIVSGVALFKRFAPLKDYLAKELDRELILETARDFPSFVRRTAERRYDIVITAPHFSLLAIDSGDYQIVARPKRDLVSLMVVAKKSKITDVSQLSGKIIATPPAPALSTRSGKDYLAGKGLQATKAPHYLAYKSHNAAYQAVLANDAVAALVSINAVNKALDNGIPLRIIDRLPPLPAMPTLVATNLDEKLAIEVRKILVNMESTKDGVNTLKRVGFPGYLSASEKDYDPVRPYKPASAILAAPKKIKK